MLDVAGGRATSIEGAHGSSAVLLDRPVVVQIALRPSGCIVVDDKGLGKGKDGRIDGEAGRSVGRIADDSPGRGARRQQRRGTRHDRVVDINKGIGDQPEGVIGLCRVEGAETEGRSAESALSDCPVAVRVSDVPSDDDVVGRADCHLTRQIPVDKGVALDVRRTGGAVVAGVAARAGLSIRTAGDGRGEHVRLAELALTSCCVGGVGVESGRVRPSCGTREGADGPGRVGRWVGCGGYRCGGREGNVGALRKRGGGLGERDGGTGVELAAGRRDRGRQGDW